MTSLLQQFLSEARDFLQGIGEKLMQLEGAADDALLMGELFRLVHTLKGNCGLFDFPEMLRVLHAAEDLMVVVRDGARAYDPQLADALLDAMDFVGVLLDEIDSTGRIASQHAATSVGLAQSLRKLIPQAAGVSPSVAPQAEALLPQPASEIMSLLLLGSVPEPLRMRLYRGLIAAPDQAPDGLPAGQLFWIAYTPEPECFFKGEDPLYLVRQCPGLVWQDISALQAWPSLSALDAYQCNLKFEFVCTASRAQLDEHFRYVPEQLSITALTPMMLVLPTGDLNGGPVYEDFVLAALAHLDGGNLNSLVRAATSMLELSSPDLWLSSALRWLLLMIEQQPENTQDLRSVLESLRSFHAPLHYLSAQSPLPEPVIAAGAVAAPEPADAALAALAQDIIATQLTVLGLPDQVAWLAGRLGSVATTLRQCFINLGKTEVLPGLDAALALALAMAGAAPLRDWLLANQSVTAATAASTATAATAATADRVPDFGLPTALATPGLAVSESEPDVKFGRRAEDVQASSKTLKVDQEKIDHLMNLIGEIVVAKNGLPYLASRAETVFGVRELAREIKAQYAVINRITEEMQSAIMKVRMLPVSFVFQRFPRLVRDISRRLGKEVSLVLEGQDTEADKNIIEALADPLIHIVRNSLDHGFETPDLRRSVGKPAEGRLTIRASQEAGRVIIDISDDGKGIDPAVIRNKAFEKGLIDAADLDRLTDHEAINLVFAAGFSTAEVVSDLSGRGVGMDVVRVAVEQVNGTVTLESKVGEGTRMRLSLPLSIAVTNVMIIESNGQIFGIPMEMVVETVRVPRSSIYAIKNHQTAVLRGRVVPLRSLNELLALDGPQVANDMDELATLVIRLRGEQVGILVDEFRGVVDIILKPMGGILGSLGAYSGSALLGDGSVLMVLNLKEMI